MCSGSVNFVISSLPFVHAFIALSLTLSLSMCKHWPSMCQCVQMCMFVYIVCLKFLKRAHDVEKLDIVEKVFFSSILVEKKRTTATHSEKTEPGLRCNRENIRERGDDVCILLMTLNPSD